MKELSKKKIRTAKQHREVAERAYAAGPLDGSEDMLFHGDVTQVAAYDQLQEPIIEKVQLLCIEAMVGIRELIKTETATLKEALAKSLKE